MEPVKLRYIIAGVESAQNLWAVRFEAAFFNRILDSFRRGTDEAKVICARYNRLHGFKASADTVAAFCAHSWGKYQIMGYNLLKYGIMNEPIWRWISSNELQEAAFDAFLAHIGLGGWGDRDYAGMIGEEKRTFARKYNGPGNVEEYVARMDKAYKEIMSTTKVKR
jgi:hypothetical protein